MRALCALSLALGLSCTASRESPAVEQQPAVVVVPRRSEAATIEVVAAWPGRSATEVEQAVTLPLEQALAGVPGLARVRSVSRSGRAAVSLELTGGAEVERARLAALERLGSAAPSLPADLHPGIGPDLDPRTPPVMFMLTATRSASTPIDQLTRAVNDALLPVPGVGALELCGERETQMIVALDAVKLAAYGITVAAASQSVAASLSEGTAAPGLVSARPVSDVSDMIVGAGSQVRLRDVATISVRPATARCEAVELVGGVAMIGAVRARRGVAPAALNAAVRARLATLAADLGARGFVLEVPEALLQVTLDLQVTGSADGTLARQNRGVAQAVVKAGLGDRLGFLQADAAGEGTVTTGAELFVTGTASPEQRAALERALSETTDVRVRAMRSDGEFEDPSRLRLTISGEELDVLQRLAEETLGVLSRVSGLAHASVRSSTIADVGIDLDGERVAAAGVSAADVRRTLAASLAGVPVGEVTADGVKMPVIVQVGEPGNFNLGSRIAKVAAIELAGTNGTVRLDELVTFRRELAPAELVRIDRRRAISVEIRRGAPPATDAEIDQAIARSLQLPRGYVVSREP